MIIDNACAFIDGKFQETSITVDNGRFSSIGAKCDKADIDAKGMYVVPGFIDIHTHGAVNEDFSDGNPESMDKLSRYYASKGVTSFLATTMTLKEDKLLPIMCAVSNFRRPSDGAECAGIHLEGPFLSYEKRGAQSAENLHKPDISMFDRLNDASGGQVRLITVAPEAEDAIPFIREASKRCTVSLGHTSADYDLSMRAFEAGASHITHTFNGMPSMLHREPGVIGAALMSGATAELICDGYHVHPSVIIAAQRMFGSKLCIISDSLRCAGLPDGRYHLLPEQPIEVKNGKATLLNGTLAGSSANLHQELKNVIKYGIPPEKAIVSLTETPAKAIKIFDTVGSLSVGKRADFLILDENFDLAATFIDGRQVYGKIG